MFSLLLVPVVAVNIVLGGCPAYPPVMDDRGVPMYYSCYVPETNTIYLAAQDSKNRFAVAHERGHAYDFQAMTPADREFLRPHLNGPELWPLEAFANAYAGCVLRMPGRNRFVCRWLLKKSVLHAAAAALAHRWPPSAETCCRARSRPTSNCLSCLPVPGRRWAELRP